MDYNKIISVTGMSGLYQLLSTRADGAVVKSLENNATKFASARQHQFSHLESIEVYTNKENIMLKDVFTAMKDSKEKMPEANADVKVLKSYFDKLGLDLDFDRVFTSDLKKMIKWFQILDKNKIDFTVQNTETEESSKSAHPGARNENEHVKDMKPQQTNPRKVESRGVK
ncbi:MAG: DUF5606 domain-containing protein [Chitinophagaceae bacterium]|nr:DUF5606 domain-containing protein [Chitinophagaceae bacterium]